MPKAYSYIRFSTPEQAKGDSLRRQISAAKEWCESHGIKLDDTLHDLGVSAFHGTNQIEGALSSFLSLVKTGKIERGSYLIVESLDRISREAVMDAVTRLLDLIRAGIIVVTLSDGQIYSDEGLRDNWMPLVFSLLVMARAHEESLMKSKRVTAAWHQKKERARIDKKPLTPRCPEWLTVINERFSIRPERVEIVKRIFQYTIDGYGRREIVKLLNAENVPTFRGGDGWHTSSIAKVIQSRATIGEYQPHTGTHKLRNRKPSGDPIKGYYPAIIDETMFWRAQSATESRRQKSAGRKGKHAHILQGLAICGTCGNPMHLLNKGKPPKGGKYLSCSSYIRGTGCTMSRRWRVEMLEEQLLRNFAIIESHSIKTLHKTEDNKSHDVNSMRAKLADAKRRQQRLIALIEAEDETAISRSLELAKEIKALSADLKEKETQSLKSESDPEIVQKIIEAATLSANLNETDQEKARDLRIRIRELIKTSIDKIICNPDIGAILHFSDRYEFHIQNKGLPVFIKIEAGKGAQFLLDKNPSQEAIDRFTPFPTDDEFFS